MAERKIKKMSIRELAFALTQHADDLQFFANGVSEDAADDFAQTEASIMEIIYELYSRYGEKGIPMDRRTQRHLDDIRRRIAEIRESMFDGETEELTGQSREVVKNEGKFLKAFFAALTGAAAIGLDAAWYDKISQYGIFGGKTIRQIMDRIASGDVDRIYTAAADGLQNRKSLDEIRESVRKEMEKTARFTKSEIVSVLNGSANDAALAFAAANRTKLMYCAVLDDRVCEECASRDGEIYEFDDDEIPSVPRHNNCRCRLIPVADEDESNRKLAMPFREYLRSLPKAEQKKRLGTAKYDLLKSGRYQLKAYEPPNGGQRLSMDELKARDKELFAIDSSKLAQLPEEWNGRLPKSSVLIKALKSATKGKVLENPELGEVEFFSVGIKEMASKKNYPFKTMVMLDLDLMQEMMQKGKAVEEPVREYRKDTASRVWRVNGEILIDGIPNDYSFIVFDHIRLKKRVLYLFELQKK